MSELTQNQTQVPNPVDIHVGARVRSRRKHMGLTQDVLAQAIGITFQQVQKYERGSNRISASKLFEIARVLKTPVTYFFDGYGAGTELPSSETERDIQDFLATAEGHELARAFIALKVVRQRRKVLELVRSLADDK